MMDVDVSVVMTARASLVRGLLWFLQPAFKMKKTGYEKASYTTVCVIIKPLSGMLMDSLTFNKMNSSSLSDYQSAVFMSH